MAAYKEASETKDRPTCIIAKTFKGSGLKGIENELDWHGKPLGDKAAELLAGLRKLVQEETLVRPEIPKVTAKVAEIKKDKEVKLASPPNYDGKKEVRSDRSRSIDRLFISSRSLLDWLMVPRWRNWAKPANTSLHWMRTRRIPRIPLNFEYEGEKNRRIFISKMFVFRILFPNVSSNVSSPNKT